MKKRITCTSFFESSCGVPAVLAVLLQVRRHLSSLRELEPAAAFARLALGPRIIVHLYSFCSAQTVDGNLILASMLGRFPKLKLNSETVILVLSFE